jgi:hypothetical protein
VARKNLTAGSTLNPSSSFATASIAPNGGDLVLAFAASVRGGGPAAPTASGNGLTWNRVASVRDGGAGNSRITCFRAMGPAPSAGPLTFDFGGQQQSACAWSVFEYDQVDLTGTNGSGAVPQHQTSSGTGNTLAAMLGPLIDPASSLVVGGIVLSINEAVAAGAGLAQIDLRPFLKGGNRGTLQTEDRTGGGPRVDWRWPTNADAGAIALEIVTAPPIVISNPPPDDPETLARQFEPILFFHPDERFYPADAKHYVEQCALWRAQAPFDVKDSWGGKGAPFDRAPIIDYGKISALAGEPGTPLGPASLVDNEGEERFFDFKGWKDASGTPQPKVTATSKNSYSNRDAIDTQYNQPDAAGGNQKLRDSRFWYHAEFFEADRLRRLLATVTAPDLVKVYDSLKNAALLNYYFFYPAHEELVAAACTNIEATEFGCFAGEWGCLSILLERRTPDSDFLPSFIGTSGRLLYAPSTPMAQAADDDDAANRMVMTVNPFPKANPVGGHPRIFVAKGTHALYLGPGPFVVNYPNESGPVDCGRFEGIPPPPAQPETHLADNPLAALGLLFAKVVAGASLLGALGAAAGLVWGIVEYAEADHGINNVATGDGPPNYAPDVTGNPGSGKMVRPSGLTVPDAGPDVQDWTSAQGVKIDGRRYDFIVDRGTQLWWPGDFNQGGYRGRWGLRVETDPFGRRAGMRFPEFWRIFFLALANGKASGAL